MAYRVCSVNPDGTAAVTTPVPDTLEAATALAVRSGGEVVSAELVAALQLGDRLPGGGIAVAEFRRSLAGVIYALGSLPEAKQRQWDRVLALLDSYTVIYPGQEPVAGLLTLAVADGLLTREQAGEISRRAGNADAPVKG